jgi:hypothetical protein
MSLAGTTLDDPAHARSSPASVDTAFARLGCPATTATAELAEFFRRYAGPFASEHIGFELLDIVEQAENVVTQTEACRRTHDFPLRYLVISNLLGNAVLIFDCETGSVFDVDFEGGEELLKAGSLAARWASLDDFLASFFLGLT